MTRRRLTILALGIAALAGGGALFGARALSAERPRCATPPKPLRYRDVAPVFDKHCNRCHDKRQSDNAAAQRVFESSRYPFTTDRPDTLLEDLEEMFASRSSLSASERCSALGWLEAGARDDGGERPPYESPGASAD
jgi:hypothetical protein